MTHTLPEPQFGPETNLQTVLAERKSRRVYRSEPVTVEDVATALWAGQGITHETDDVEMRTAPSAGATYPLETYLEVAPEGCEALSAGLYHYVPETHTLETVHTESVHESLTEAALSQRVVGNAPATVVLTAEYDRTVSQYPDHGRRYVHMEAGHVSQNVQLACESRGLSNCPVGAFHDDALADVLDLDANLDPLYLLPFGPQPE